MAFSAPFIVGGGGGESICCTGGFCRSNKTPPPPSNLTPLDRIHTLACYHSPSVACGIPSLSWVSLIFASLQGRSRAVAKKQACAVSETQGTCVRTPKVGTLLAEKGVTSGDPYFPKPRPLDPSKEFSYSRGAQMTDLDKHDSPQKQI